jgi:hypothetical protein
VTRSAADSNVHVHASYSYVGFGSRFGQTQYNTIGANVVVGGSYTYTGFNYTAAPRTRVTIDPNVRVRGNDTYAGFEDVDGPIAVGEAVEVHEAESGLTGHGRVTEIDAERKLVYLSVDWPSLAEGGPQREPSVPTNGFIFISAGESLGDDDWMSHAATPCLAAVGFSSTTLWVDAPAGSYSTQAVSLGYRSPYLEVPSGLEIVQSYAALRDRIVA